MSIKITNHGVGRQVKQWRELISQHKALQEQVRVMAQHGATELAVASRKRTPVKSRPGRLSGVMQDNIIWQVEGDTVRLDYARLEGATKTSSGGNYWMIQEIGTGQSANMVEYLPGGGRTDSPIKIPSQVGRKISPGLVFMAAGRAVPPLSGGKGEPIVPYKETEQAKDSAAGRGFRAGSGSFFKYINPYDGIEIGKEIEGKHFIRNGGAVAATHYRNELPERVKRIRGIKLRRGG